MSYVLAGVGFALLIILHEFGHFMAAKATGMRVERFALFFPPLLLKVRRGETEYGIGAIPLGGFVKITGMNPEEKLPPDVAPRAYYHQPVWKRVVVILAGPAMNLLIAFFLLFGLAFGAAKPNSEVAALVRQPAKSALHVGDRILSVDGVGGSPDNLRKQTAKHRCSGTPVSGCVATTPAVLRVERDHRLITIRVRPRYSVAAKQTLIGFSFGSRPLNPDVPEAAHIAVNLMWSVTSATVGVVARLFESQKRKEVSGVVGSYEVTRQSFAKDARRALTLLAVISLSLAIINLFPFLPLDGGHVFWSLLEKIRGEAVPFRILEQASVIGFMLVMVLFLIGFTNDIDRLSGGGFQTP